METILRHCSVMCPKDFRDANDGGDDVFYCEYEYDIHWHNFKRLADIDDEPEVDAHKLKILSLEAWTPLQFTQ
jgi:origin recognition complex subunit 1